MQWRWLPAWKQAVGCVAATAAVLTAGVWVGHRLDPTWGKHGGPVADFVAVDQDERSVSRASLDGHPWVADFIYTSCRSTCPLLTARLATLRRSVADPNVRFVSFSVDPERDTPEALKAYAARWGASDSRWRLLRIDRATVARVAGSLGAPVIDGLHSDRFFLMDDVGTERGAFSSTDPELARRLRIWRRW